MEITTGWRFMSADFSVQACINPLATGTVTLIRCPEECARWHSMPLSNKGDGGPPLFVYGHGKTLDAAIANANRKAGIAMPIPIEEGK